VGNAFWSRLFEVEQAAFHLSREQRREAIAEVIDFPHQLMVADIFEPYREAVLTALRQADSAERLHDEENGEGGPVAAYMVKAFLDLNSDRLGSTSIEHLRGMAKAMVADFKDRARAALSDPIAFDVTCSIAALYIKPGTAISEDVCEFVVGVLEGRITRPQVPKGPSAFSNFGKNQCIVEAIRIGVSHGLSATRNDASDPVSSCDFVALALEQMGHKPSSFAGVKRIWNARGAEIGAIHRAMTGTGESLF
jgi:hypothetical protein